MTPEEELEREQRRSEIMAQISNLESQRDKLNTEIEELTKQENEINAFETAFNTQFDTCRSGMNSIGTKISEVDCSRLSNDSNLSKLPDINQSISKITSETMENMDSEKSKIDGISKTKKEEIQKSKKEKQDKVKDLDTQIQSLYAELNSL